MIHRLAFGLLATALICPMTFARTEQLSLPGYPGISASIELGNGSCMNVLPVTVVATQASDLADGGAVRKVMAWAQLMAQTECPKASRIDLSTFLNGRIAYTGFAQKSSGWVFIAANTRPPETHKVNPPPMSRALSSERVRALSDKPTVVKQTPAPSATASEPQRLPETPAAPSTQKSATATLESGPTPASIDPQGADSSKPDALEQLRHDAEAGEVESQFNLGLAYEIGTGTEVDEKQAMVWYRKAAIQGNAMAQRKVAKLYGKAGGEENQKLGAEWMRKSADQGYDQAQIDLALQYATGRGVPKDVGQTAIWFEKAARQGNTEAQKFLAMMYEEGHGVPLDKEMALYWYRQAAAQGDLTAKGNIRRLKAQ